MSIEEIRLVDFPVRLDDRGTLAVIETPEQVPFTIRRLYYLYRVAPGQQRGGHAHKALEQVFVAMAGRFSITLTDARAVRTFELTDPSVGLYVPPMLWRDLHDFSADAVCLVIASAEYSEDDYIRSRAEFGAAVARAEPSSSAAPSSSPPSAVTIPNRT